MNIVADENIPLLESFFSGFGPIRALPGRAIRHADLADADVLLVRSVTPVGESLLAGSTVRFVGTCTIGTDHLDLDYLQRSHITWSSAPGCNARGVVDYVLGSLLSLAERSGCELASRRYGIVGAGQVGQRLVNVLRGLGWPVLVCDPTRQRAEGGDYVSLDQLLAECDVISLHTPLERSGPDPTWHLLDAERLSTLRPEAWLINASRGAVVDNVALTSLLSARSDVQAVLDVWEGEPSFSEDLARRCHLATPHIAGYSLDGRMRGTEQVYKALCAHLGQPAELTLSQLLPPRWLEKMTISADADIGWALTAICRAIYDPRRDDADFRRLLTMPEVERPAGFDRLRKSYPVRREIEGFTIEAGSEPARLQTLVDALGARLA